MPKPEERQKTSTWWAESIGFEDGIILGSAQINLREWQVVIEDVPPNIIDGPGGGRAGMRGLLLLSGVGAAVYTLLVITHDALPGGNDTLSGQTQSNRPVGERLGSWDSYLAPSPSRNPQMAISQGSAPLPPQLGDDASQSSKRKPGTEHQPATSEDKTPASLSVGAEPEPVEWAKVMLAAQTHSESSVSSPTIRFYTPVQNCRSSDEKAHGSRYRTR